MVRTITEDDGSHGGEDGTGKSIFNIAILLGLDGPRERSRSHRLDMVQCLVYSCWIAGDAYIGREREIVRGDGARRSDRVGPQGILGS